MKIRIDREKCAGHARCSAIAPQIYALDDVGYIATQDGDVPANLEKEARRGARACPERIIAIEE